MGLCVESLIMLARNGWAGALGRIEDIAAF